MEGLIELSKGFKAESNAEAKKGEAKFNSYHTQTLQVMCLFPQSTTNATPCMLFEKPLEID